MLSRGESDTVPRVELADVLEQFGLARDDAMAWRLAGHAPVGAISRSRFSAESEDRDLEIAPTADDDTPGDWINLAAAVTRTLLPADLAPPAPLRLWPRWDEAGPPLVLGVAGGQGSGKSTLARQLERALRAAGARTAACSLDDFYLSRAHRAGLAARVHPLLATRGVPGTHDVAALAGVIDALGHIGSVALPVFDKGSDDPLPPAQWRRVDGPVDVLVLEGWCVGARPQSDAALLPPVNALERDEDPDGRWRRYVNDALGGPYAELWSRLDALVYLRVPGMAAVRRWRAEQELGLPAGRRMDAAAIERFVAHYERLTAAMVDDLPARADVTAELDDAHTVAAIRCRARS